MTDLIKDYWLWVVVPFLLVVGGLAVLYLLSDGSVFGDFVYPVF